MTQRYERDPAQTEIPFVLRPACVDVSSVGLEEIHCGITVLWIGDNEGIEDTHTHRHRHTLCEAHFKDRSALTGPAFIGISYWGFTYSIFFSSGADRSKRVG